MTPPRRSQNDGFEPSAIRRRLGGGLRRGDVDRALREARDTIDALNAELEAERVRSVAAAQTERELQETIRALRDEDELIRSRDALAAEVDDLRDRLSDLRLAVRQRAEALDTLARDQRFDDAAAASAEAVTESGTPVDHFNAAVDLVTGVFPDLRSVLAFERDLGRLPEVEDVYIQELIEGRAKVRLTRRKPGPLLAELHAYVSMPIDVEEADWSRIVLRVTGVPASTRAG